MFVFGHTGITAGVVQGINTFTRRKFDLRLAMFFGLLPDLLDKPIGIIYRNDLGNHTRLWAHSLIFSLVVLAVLHSYRARIRDYWVYWLCYLGHFVLDRMWINDSYALFWPFLDHREPLDITLLQKWLDAIRQPWTIFGEVTGFSILIFLVVKYRLDRQVNRRKFLKTGLLVAAR